MKSRLALQPMADLEQETFTFLYHYDDKYLFSFTFQCYRFRDLQSGRTFNQQTHFILRFLKTFFGDIYNTLITFLKCYSV